MKLTEFLRGAWRALIGVRADGIDGGDLGSV